MLRVAVVWQSDNGRAQWQCRNGCNGQLDLGRAEMADAAIVGQALVVPVIEGSGSRRVRMFVMTEVRLNLNLLQGAIRRGRREGELEGKQHEEEKCEEAAHGGIMTELRH